jgi:hypothetical protein
MISTCAYNAMVCRFTWTRGELEFPVVYSRDKVELAEKRVAAVLGALTFVILGPSSRLSDRTRRWTASFGSLSSTYLCVEPHILVMSNSKWQC